MSSSELCELCGLRVSALCETFKRREHRGRGDRREYFSDQDTTYLPTLVKTGLLDAFAVNDEKPNDFSAQTKGAAHCLNDLRGGADAEK